MTPLEFCRSCGEPVTRTFVDLGEMPLANSYPDPNALPGSEARYPLHAVVCDTCFLVQLHHDVPPSEIFGDYAYFSSYSDSWLEHADRFATDATERFRLDRESFVIEVASNDGYLLRHFLRKGIPVLGIDPAENVAATAMASGVPTRVEFLGRESATRMVSEGLLGDLVVANNVLAHVPDLNDFISGLALLLKREGVLSIEFPHVLNLIEEVQFDTIYHEHFSYFSLLAAETALARHGLRVFDVELLPTHGGSLRLLVGHEGAHHRPETGLDATRKLESDAGMDAIETYAGYSDKVRETQRSILRFFKRVRDEHASVAAYGAAAKGNTLLNSCRLTSNDIAFVVDRNPAKQGRLLPGSRIPVKDPSEIKRFRPDYLLILPWNIQNEIMDEMRHVLEWGGRFVTAIPQVKVHP